MLRVPFLKPDSRPPPMKTYLRSLPAAALVLAACGPAPDVQDTETAVSAVVTPVARINFQTGSTVTPAGYQADTGAVFGVRASGLSYGWNLDGSAFARERNSATSLDKRHDTLN